MPSARPRFRLYLAVSLDGFIATADGSIGWLEAFDPNELGFKEFLGSIRTIVMGRTSYEEAARFDQWPYEGKHIVVLTRRDFKPSTPNTEGWNKSIETLAERLSKETTGGDVWIFGGGETARAFLNARQLDTLELYVVPILLGTGIPLFDPGT